MQQGFSDFLDFDLYLREHNGKIIHQIWFGTIPNKKQAKKDHKKLEIYRNSWKIKNPEWYHVEWNREMCIEFIKKLFPEHLEMFKKYQYEIQRCDAVRYLLLYRYGGFYVDQDYICLQKLDKARENFNNDVYLVQSPNSVYGQDPDHISNSMMFSIPNHPFWKQVMIELEKNQKTPFYYTRHLSVMFSTGPGILNRIYRNYKFRYNIKSLPYKLFQPFGIKDEKMLDKLDKDVYAVHMGKGSWESSDTKMLLFFFRDWKIILIIILMLSLPILYNGIVSLL